MKAKAAMTAHGVLAGRRILLVEDEYFIADDLRLWFCRDGATVLGPVGTVKDALALLTSDAPIDGAVIDIDLGGELAYPIADQLMSRHIPFVFATGYDGEMLPARYAAARRCEKPVSPDMVAAALFV